MPGDKHKKKKGKKQDFERSQPKTPNYKGRNTTLSYILIASISITAFALFFIYLPNIRSFLGFTTIDPEIQRGHRARLQQLYEKYNPDKLNELDSILSKWQGKEQQLFKILHNKYVKPNKEKENQRKEKEKEKKRKEKEKGGSEASDPQKHRREREQLREERRKQRQEERGGADYYDEWNQDELSPGERETMDKYFDQEGRSGGQYAAKYEGEIELVDDTETNDS